MHARYQELIESSWAALQPRADELTRCFYDRLFLLHPQAAPLFAGTEMEEQRKKLAATLALLAASIRDPNRLRAPLQQMGRRHEQYGVQPRDYEPVGQALIFALAATLGPEQWTESVEAAWLEAYTFVKEAMLEGARAPVAAS